MSADDGADAARGGADADKPLGVSILLLMKDHLSDMERGFESIRDQDYPGPVEMVYVDSGGTDGTVAFMHARGIEAHMIPAEEFHHGRTRNLAATLATHEILVTLSADACPVDATWLSNLVQPFDDSEVDGVYGKQVPLPEMGGLRRRAMEALYHDDHEVRVLHDGKTLSLPMLRFSNANAAFRASRWRVHPFRENGVVAEDHGLCFDILMSGKKVVYAPAAAVIHGHERNWWGEFQFSFENGFSLDRMGILGHPRVGSELNYGLRRIAKDLRYFVSRFRFLAAFSSAAISIIKWLGVQCGKRERFIPGSVLRRISPMTYRLTRESADSTDDTHD